MTLHIKRLNIKRFNRWAHVYDRSILQHLVFRTSHDRFLENILPLYRHKHDIKILDVGCGTGEFAFGLSDHMKNADIHGVDISFDMAKIAKSKLKDHKVRFKVGDVEDLPYPDNTFNIITCSNSFHHYPNKKRALKEMHRVLKQDGHLMIVDGCRDVPWGLLIFKVVEIFEKHAYHIYGPELRDLLNEAGFHQIGQKRFNPIAPLLFTMGSALK